MDHKEKNLYKLVKQEGLPDIPLEYDASNIDSAAKFIFRKLFDASGAKSEYEATFEIVDLNGVVYPYFGSRTKRPRSVMRYMNGITYEVDYVMKVILLNKEKGNAKIDVPYMNIGAEERVFLNLRGKKMEVYKHSLLPSLFFRGVLGDLKFKKTEISRDMPLFVDCDKDSFEEVLSYMEFGNPKTLKLHPSVFKGLLDKFGIEIKKKKSKETKTSEAYEEFINSLFKNLNEFIKSKLEKKDWFKLDISFVKGENSTLFYPGDSQFVVEYSRDFNSKLRVAFHTITTSDIFFKPLTDKFRVKFELRQSKLSADRSYVLRGGMADFFFSCVASLYEKPDFYATENEPKGLFIEVFPNENS